MDIREQYRVKVIEWVEQWSDEFPDVWACHIDIMVSIMCTRDDASYHGGSFVTAIVKNDLYNAVTRADRDNLKLIKLYTLCNSNCYL